MNDYLAERLRGLAYMSDDEWAQGTLREAADEIDRLNDVTDRMFQQIEQLISDLVDSREETRRLHRLIVAWCDAEDMLLQFPFGLESAEATAKADHHYGLKCDAQRALRKAVGR